MFDLNSLALGSGFLLLGIISFLLILFSLRAIPRLRAREKNFTPPSIPLDLSRHEDAVLLVQAGGKVAYLNRQAREWFNQWEDQPNLENLARQVRPGEVFLSLCAGEGQARLSVDGRILEATSYIAPQNGNTPVLVSLRHPRQRSSTATRWR